MLFILTKLKTRVLFCCFHELKLLLGKKTKQKSDHLYLFIFMSIHKTSWKLNDSPTTKNVEIVIHILIHLYCMVGMCLHPTVKTKIKNNPTDRLPTWPERWPRTAADHVKKDGQAGRMPELANIVSFPSPLKDWQRCCWDSETSSKEPPPPHVSKKYETVFCPTGGVSFNLNTTV